MAKDSRQALFRKGQQMSAQEAFRALSSVHPLTSKSHNKAATDERAPERQGRPCRCARCCCTVAAAPVIAAASFFGIHQHGGQMVAG